MNREVLKYLLQLFRRRKEPISILGLLSTGILALLYAYQDPLFGSTETEIGDIIMELPWWLPPDIVYV